MNNGGGDIYNSIIIPSKGRGTQFNYSITIIILITAFISIIAVHLTTLSIIKSSKNLKSVAN